MANLTELPTGGSHDNKEELKMASINGISIKSLKCFRDHEGASCFQGNIYYKGKKLGFWSQDPWGGPDSYDFDESVLDGEVEKYAASDMVEEKYREFTELDALLCDVLALMDDEKSYKKCTKMGYSTYVCASDGFHVRGYYSALKTAEAVRKDVYHKNFIKECGVKFFKDWKESDKTVKIYCNPDDFAINV